MAVETGVVPARYADARAIGHGGMGEIYLAEDRELDRSVAIKVLDERFADSEQLRRRFNREALTAARLSGHPHVVTIFDVGEWRGRPFIVMEYLPGGTLAERARAGQVPHADALSSLGQAAEALDAAHELGVVHRDVKPANLLFDARGNVVVADFGIARVADDTTGGMTAAGTVIGTAGYLAPEQALGQPATAASDRYALGIVAYELLTGGRPFERGSTTAEAAAHIHEPVPSASQRGVGLPPAVDAIFERALAKDPRARYPTAAQFVEALRAALSPAEEPTRVFPVGATARSRAPIATRSRAFPWLPFVVVGLLLVGVGGVAAAVFATGSDDAPATSVPARVTVTEKVPKVVQGEVVTETVVTTIESEPAAPPPSGGATSVSEAVALTDQSTYALRSGDWEGAARLAQQAYAPLQGTYSGDFRYEAYVNYDLGKALVELGRCGEALRYLGRSEQLQGHRSEIDEARAQCDGD